MKNENEIDKEIISEINNCFSKINSLLNQQNEELSDIYEYFLINKTWLEKYLSITKKDSIFKDLIYFMLQKIPLPSPCYIYQYDQKNYRYLNNFKIVPKKILPHFLSIINDNKNDSSNNDKDIIKYTPNKMIFKYSKIILFLEEDVSIEILNKNIIPEYLLCFNKNTSIEQMIDIFLNEMKSNIPENSKNNIIYVYDMKNGIKLTIINLEKVLNEEKLETNKISKHNCNEVNQLWENKYKNKIDKLFNDITDKYNENFKMQINLKNETFYKNLKDQFKEQNKIFKENYNNIISKINDSKIKNDNEKDNINVNENDSENKMSLIIDNYFDKNDKEENNKNNNNKKENDINDFFIINDAKEIDLYNNNSNKTLNKKKLNLIIIPTLFFLSKIKSLKEYLYENKESLDLIKFVEDDTLIPIIVDFFDEIKDIKEKEITDSEKELFNKYSNLLINFLVTKNKDKLNTINSPGNLLSIILEILDEEQNKYLTEQQSSIDLNKDKIYDIYNKEEMLQMFIDKFSINHKTFIFNKFYNILESSKLCKKCFKRAYEFQAHPTLNITLKKSNSLANEDISEYEMYNTILCTIRFPENIDQLLSPSFLLKKTEFCKSCEKYNEIIFNQSIFVIKEYLIVNIDREDDPKNEMIFIYPETLDLRNHSKFIINLYQLTGVICKKINAYNYNINDVDDDISYYIFYFKNQNNNKWLCFDENYKIYELESNKDIFNFKELSFFLYSKIEDK